MYCALSPDDLVRVDDIASAHKISRSHLLKATRHLGSLGYLKNTRGRSGGIQLGRPASEITVGEVVRHTEGNFELVECFNAETNSCPLIGICVLSETLSIALDAFLKVLDGVTVADLVAPAEAINARLAAAVPTDADSSLKVSA